jgi:hypothetical protein
MEISPKSAETKTIATVTRAVRIILSNKDVGSISMLTCLDRKCRITKCEKNIKNDNFPILTKIFLRRNLPFISVAIPILRNTKPRASIGFP